jgi:hypothetical protein
MQCLQSSPSLACEKLVEFGSDHFLRKHLADRMLRLLAFFFLFSLANAEAELCAA